MILLDITSTELKQMNKRRDALINKIEELGGVNRTTAYLFPEIDLHLKVIKNYDLGLEEHHRARNGLFQWIYVSGGFSSLEAAIECAQKFKEQSEKFKD